MIQELWDDIVIQEAMELLEKQKSKDYDCYDDAQSNRTVDKPHPSAYL